MIKKLKQHVEQNPSAIALQVNGELVSYQKCWQKASANARHLRLSGAKEGDIVALHLTKSVDFVVMQIACHMLGVAFMPLPPAWPLARKQQLLACSDCLLVVTEDALEMTISQLKPSQAQLALYEFITPKPSALAYVLFTSGSSGEPKGVKVPFSGLAPVINSQRDMVGVQAGQRCLWLHDHAFDASIADVWLTLTAGATLVVDTNTQGLNIVEKLSAHKIHYVDLPTPLLNYIEPGTLPANLHSILVGGDTSDVNKLITFSHHVNVIVAYGPTEATICTSMYRVNEQAIYGCIGVPLDHLHYYVVNSCGKPVAQGEPGELIIVGAGVALGYINSAEKRFSEWGGQRTYRTGDRVKQENGLYYFLGRMDRQLKIQGKLICPEEVEQHLLTHSQVKEAYVFSYQNRLVAAVGMDVKSIDLLSWLADKLPSFMHPTCWLYEPSLPRNTHYKVDITALVNALKQRSIVAENDLLSLIHQVTHQYTITLHDCPQQAALDSIVLVELVLSLNHKGWLVSLEQLQCAKQWSDLEQYALPESFHLGAADSDILKKELTFPTLYSSEKPQRHKALLITGAAGHLGRHLLSLASQHKDKSKRLIFCLTRGDGSLHLQDYCEKNTIDFSNIIFLTGDVTQVRLGLPTKQWQQLADQVSDIYHCAANMSLACEREALFNTNVVGTYHVLQLLSEGQKKRLHFMSTLSLVVDSNWKYEFVDEHNSLERGIFYGGYTQTKWQAEQLARSCDNVVIYRLGLLLGDIKEHFPVNDWLNTQLLKRPDFSGLPQNYAIDMTPITIAAQWLWGISQQAPSGSTYHIIHPHSVSAETLALVIGLGGPQWPIEHANDPMRLFKMTDTQIDSQQSNTWAKQLGIHLPSINQHYLKQYCEALWNQ